MFAKSENHLFTARTARIAVATTLATTLLIGVAYVMQDWYLFMTA